MKTSDNLIETLTGQGEAWVCLYPDGSPVGFADGPSSGYPYRAHTLRDVKFWHRYADAAQYQSTMYKENFTVHEVNTIEIGGEVTA